jgi:hypothetical protein
VGATWTKEDIYGKLARLASTKPKVYEETPSNGPEVRRLKIPRIFLKLFSKLDIVHLLQIRDHYHRLSSSFLLLAD